MSLNNHSSLKVNGVDEALEHYGNAMVRITQVEARIEEVSKRLAAEGQPIAGWGDIASKVGKGLIAIAPAYIGYKSSKDASKLQKAQFEFQKRQAQAPRDIMEKTAPPPNLRALEELKRRWALAMQNKPQPPAGPYQPFVDPRSPNYVEAVNKTAG